MDDHQQTPEERRKTRLKYRELIETLQEKEEELKLPGSNELTERLNEANDLFKPVRTTREAVLDSRAMSIIANIGRQKAQALHTEFVRFQPTEFADKLVAFVSGNNESSIPTVSQSSEVRISAEGWDKLGEAVQSLYNKSPYFHYMAGSFERGPPKVQERKSNRAAKEKDNTVGKETIPQKLTGFGASNKSEATTEEVERVFQLLQQKYEECGEHALCYFDFVLNPYSFGQTVENIFYASFLVRDSLAKVFLDDEGLPVIEPRTNRNQEKEKEAARRHQTIFSITPQDWQRLIKVYKVTEPAIPSRSSLTQTENNPVSNGTQSKKQRA